MKPIHANHPEAESALAMALTFRDNVHAFSNIGIYGQRLARQFERALLQLRQIQTERREKERKDLNRAADLLERHQEREQLPYNPARDGFVFSNDQIETFIQRRDRLSLAQLASLHRYAACG